MTSGAGPKPPVKGRAEHFRLCPPSSDIYLFCYCERVVDLNSQVSDGALDFRMPQKKLHGPQVACAPIDEGRLCATQ